jgi:DNA-binding MarR family transcriptional regulator
MGEKYSANLGLTAYQRHSLRFLLVADGQRLTLGELASRLETTSANTTKLVNRMQRSGMVRRELDSGDRRVVWVVLTPLGEEKYLAALPISPADREAFSVLSLEEQETLIDLLTRVQEKVGQLLEAMPPGSPTDGVATRHAERLLATTRE